MRRCIANQHTSLIMSSSSAWVGFWPSERMTVPSSLVVMVPSPSVERKGKYQGAASTIAGEEEQVREARRDDYGESGSRFGKCGQPLQLQSTRWPSPLSNSEKASLNSRRQSSAYPPGPVNTMHTGDLLWASVPARSECRQHTLGLYADSQWRRKCGQWRFCEQRKTFTSCSAMVLGSDDECPG